MKRGIEMSWAYDYKDRLALEIKKKRGKLTLDEIEDLLRYENGQQYWRRREYESFSTPWN